MITNFGLVVICFFASVSFFYNADFHETQSYSLDLQKAKFG